MQKVSSSIYPSTYDFSITDESANSIQNHLLSNCCSSSENHIAIIKSIRKIFCKWNKEIEKSIMQNPKKIRCKYVCKKSIASSSFVCLIPIFKSHFQFITDITHEWDAGTKCEEYALLPNLGELRGHSHILFEWRQDHPTAVYWQSRFALPYKYPKNSELMAALWQETQEGKKTDVKVLSNAITFNLHTFVLERKLPCFFNALTSSWKEGENKEMKLDHKQPSVLEALFQYIYEVPNFMGELDFEILIDLFASAHEYQLPELQKIISTEIGTQLPTDTGIPEKVEALLRSGCLYEHKEFMNWGLKLANGLEKEDFLKIIAPFNSQQLELLLNNCENVSHRVISKLKNYLILRQNQ